MKIVEEKGTKEAEVKKEKKKREINTKRSAVEEKLKEKMSEWGKKRRRNAVKVERNSDEELRVFKLPTQGLPLFFYM